MGEEVKPNEKIKRGYYLRKHKSPYYWGGLFVTYYDGDDLFTICNLNPDIDKIQQGGEDYLFFNQYSLKDIFMSKDSSVTRMGNFYLSQLPDTPQFINWRTDPLSSRK